ncbi:MAG: DUF6261 family protein [Marinifilaceae bacterium]
MIHPINLLHLSNEESYSFGKEIHTTLREYSSRVLPLALLAKNLKTALQIMHRTLNKEKDNGTNLKLAQAMIQREKAYQGLFNYITACSYRLKEKWQLPAELLLNTLEPHNWDLQTESYSDRNTQYLKLLWELENNLENATALSRLEATDWLIELQQSQDQCELAQKDWNEKQTDANAESIGEGLIAVNEAIQNTIQYIELMYRMKPTKTFAKLALQINEVISQTTQTHQEKENNEEYLLEEEMSH